MKLRLPIDLLDRLDAYARRRGVSRNALIRMILFASIEEEDRRP